MLLDVQGAVLALVVEQLNINTPTRQSGPDSGPGVRVKLVKTLQVVLSSSGAGAERLRGARTWRRTRPPM
jgi:hypothetical protein